MKIIKLFLASSIVEFEHERKELGDYIRTLNDHYMECGSDIYIKLEICEDLSNALAKERKQEEYNKKIRESDFFYIIFGKAAGEYTIEEFDVALEHFKETESPRIYTYFQKLPDGVEAADSVKRFMERLDKELGHYYSQFSHIDSIKLNMLIEITRSKAVNGKLDIKDGKALLNGKEMLSLENVPIFRNNEELHSLIKEREALKKNHAELAVRYAADPDNPDLLKQLTEGGNRLKELNGQLHQMEKNVLLICMNIADLTGSGEPISWREKAACECFDEGNYRGALAILSDPNIEEELKQAEEVGTLSDSKYSEYIRIKSLKIKGLKALGINTGTLADIYKCYEEAVKVAEDHFIDTSIIYDYASFLHDQKDYKKALEKAEWLQKYYELKKSTGDYEKSALYNLLGVLYHDTDRYPEAAAYYKKAIEINERLRSENPSAYASALADSYNNIGTLYDDTNRLTEAEEYYKKAKEIWEGLSSENPSSYASSLAICYNNIGSLNKYIDCYEEAEEYFEKAIKTWKCLASGAPSVYENGLASSYDTIGTLYSDTDRYTEAEEYHKKAIKIRERLASENPSAYAGDLASSYNTMGDLYSDTDRYEDAGAYYKKAIEIWERLASASPSVYEGYLASGYNTIGDLYSDTNRYEEAEAYYKKAIEIRERLVSENPSVYESGLADSYNTIGDLYSDTDRYEKAEAYYKKAQEIRERLA